MIIYGYCISTSLYRVTFSFPDAPFNNSRLYCVGEFDSVAIGSTGADVVILAHNSSEGTVHFYTGVSDNKKICYKELHTLHRSR